MKNCPYCHLEMIKDQEVILQNEKCMSFKFHKMYKLVQVLLSQLAIEKMYST